MLAELLARFQQGHRTISYPKGLPVLPDRFRGLPEIVRDRCPSNCTVCHDACPVGAITQGDSLKIDLGRCLFCTECLSACPTGALKFTTDHQLAASTRASMEFDGGYYERAQALKKDMRRLFGRSLKLRQVSAGGCNGCEADVNVLSTVVFDLGRFGISFVASPRHADGILVTGPVSKNMREALLKTYDAVPSPKLVIASGACAISGGPFRDNPEVLNGVEPLIPVDLYIPGCPPHPLTALDGLLRLLGRIDSGERKAK